VQARHPVSDPAPAEGSVAVRPDLTLHIATWPGAGQPFVLLHGLASNKQTWRRVGQALAAAGHRVVAVDQRGHGLSDKPTAGYDFGTITDDLALLLDALGLEAPLIAGQSWGGNVVLEFGARYPRRAAGLIFVDGGILDLQQGGHAGGDWEAVAQNLRPPPLTGTPRSALKQLIATHNPTWDDDGVEATLGNFETLPDGTVRPWLTLDRHMLILRALWEQRPGDLYARVQAPVLIAMADDGHGSAWTVAKHRMVATAQAALPRSKVHWFHDTAHDIHVHRPLALASLMLEQVQEGFWPAGSPETLEAQSE
jgi:pimeloyl-ACP methyl ester carboxylesterase